MSSVSPLWPQAEWHQKLSQTDGLLAPFRASLGMPQVPPSFFLAVTKGSHYYREICLSNVSQPSEWEVLS